MIGDHGLIHNIPVIRLRLSEATKRLIVASYRVTDNRFAHAIKWHRSDGTLTISGVTVTGPEGRQSYEELTTNGLVRQESEAILRLTDEGRGRAQELIDDEGC